MIKDVKFAVHSNPARRAFEIFLVARNRDGKTVIPKPVEFTEMANDFEQIDPLIVVSDYEADALNGLMDELWNAGFRPRGHDGDASVNATKKHLADMRKIAFKFLEMEE